MPTGSDAESDKTASNVALNFNKPFNQSKKIKSL
jgi:hypothetical protein